VKHVALLRVTAIDTVESAPIAKVRAIGVQMFL
jgi:hypothetical protein